MKRFISCIAAIFTLFISCSMPLAAFAYTSVDEEDPNFYTFEEWRNGFHNTSSNYEFIFKYTDSRLYFDEYRPLYYTCGVSFSDYESNVESAVMDGSLFDVTFKRSQSFLYSEKAFRTIGNFYWNYNVRRFTFDFSNNTLSLYGVDGSPIGIGFNSNIYSVEVVEYTTNFEEFSHSSCPLEFQFSPVLSGNVDRSYSIGDVTYYSDRVIMGVTNKSSDSWAYDFTIYQGDSVVYQFLSYEWQNTFDIADNEITHNEVFMNRHSKVQLIGTDWHLVKGNSSVIQNFLWTQLPLRSNTTYRIECYAYKSPTSDYLSSIASMNLTGADRGEAVDDPVGDFMIKNAVLAYSSEFVLINFDDVIYDHNDSSNGIIPYNSIEDFYRARTSRLAVKDDNGNIDYSDYSAYDDPNSWFNNGQIRNNLEAVRQMTEDTKAGKHTISSGGNYTFTGGTINFNSMARVFPNFFGFLNAFFSYLPSDVWSLIYFGFVAIIVVGIIKKVI